MINVTFDTLDDMLHFANRLTSLREASQAPVQENSPAVSVTPVPQAPVAPISQAPVQQTVTAAPITAATVQTLAPTQQAAAAPAIQQTAPVQTSAPSYSMDDLTNAAVMLMDSGRQADLLNLLAQFGVEALPALPREQYGAFATALRGLGAQI